jgi:hypothetical protein
MANFRLSEHGKDVSRFVIPQGRSAQLVQWGDDHARNKLELDLSTAGGAFHQAQCRLNAFYAVGRPSSHTTNTSRRDFFLRYLTEARGIAC